MKELVKINLYKTLIILVLVGSINWGLVGVFNFDLVKEFSSLFGYDASGYVAAFIYILVGMSAIVLSIQRDTYLPFLGHTVMPQPTADYTQPQPQTGTLITKVVENLPANVKVIYWAALPSETVVDNPTDAYGDYSNQGVTTTDANGKAILQVRKPASYKVPFKGTLEPHIHYRYWTSSGMTSRLFTIKI
jgi:uncharacterized membrane protein YuzA (DUF378 family)